MVKPHFIPRTLKGVGGIRLFDIPGVVYPKEMLITKVGLNHKNGRPYKEAPVSWGIPTSEAAAILHCTPSAARTWLHRRKVPFRIVGEEGQSLRLFWRKERVQALAEERLPVLEQRSVEMIDSVEAQRILGVGRSTLYRYERRGQLSVTKVRKPSPRGLRTCSYYHRTEVERLAQYLHSMRAKEAEMRSFRQVNRPSNRSAPSEPEITYAASSSTPRRARLNKKCK